MTFVAVSNQNRTNLLFKKFQLLRRRFRRASRNRDARQDPACQAGQDHANLQPV